MSPRSVHGPLWADERRDATICRSLFPIPYSRSSIHIQRTHRLAERDPADRLGQPLGDDELADTAAGPGRLRQRARVADHQLVELGAGHVVRSEERRGGTEGVGSGKLRSSPYYEKKNT